MLESLGEVYPEAKYQRCVVHFYRNVFSASPRKIMREVSMMLKAIHAQENREAAVQKAKAVANRLKELKLSRAAKIVEDGVDETLAYMYFPSQHWLRIRTNNTIERVNREIKHNGQSALMLVCARLRQAAGSAWETKRYLNMQH